MTKEKKITVKPFLNKRLNAITIEETSETGEIKTYKYYPLYYLIRYDRNNTQIAAASVWDNSASHYLFKSLELNEREFYSNKLLKNIISDDTEIILRIIRYLLKTEKEFELKGIKNVVFDFKQNMFHLLNYKMKSYLKDQLYRNKEFKWMSIINYARPDISFYFVYTTLQKLMNVKSILSEKDLQHISTLKIFFETFQKNYNSLPDGVSEHQDNLLGLLNDQTKYCKINWLCGELDSEIRTILNNNRQTEISFNDIKDTINWLLTTKTTQL